MEADLTKAGITISQPTLGPSSTPIGNSNNITQCNLGHADNLDGKNNLITTRDAIENAIDDDDDFGDFHEQKRVRYAVRCTCNWRNACNTK